MAAFVVNQRLPGGWMMLITTLSNHNGVVAETTTMPTGIGPVSVYEAWLNASDIATMVANPELLAPEAYVLQNARVSGWFPFSRWRNSNGFRLNSYANPDNPILVGPEDTIQWISAETDTNGAPTVDYNFRMLCKQLS